MNLTEIKTELRLQDHRYDPFGVAMDLFFEVALHLHQRREYVPELWQFKPGLFACPDKDSHWYEFLVDFGNDELREIGNFLNRYVSFLNSAGKTY